MNKQELIRKISEDTNLTQKQASAALDSMLDAIMDAVKNHEKVQLVGFGTFEAKQRNARERKARQGRNPRKPGEIIKIAASKAPVFKAGKVFKDAVK